MLTVHVKDIPSDSYYTHIHILSHTAQIHAYVTNWHHATANISSHEIT
jgi:hypothetical protein